MKAKQRHRHKLHAPAKLQTCKLILKMPLECTKEASKSKPIICATKKSLSMTTKVLLALASLLVLVKFAHACQLPPTWTGRWYQANKEPIRVTNTEISDKGLCRDKKGDKYLFEYVNKQQQQPCLVCLVINERHLNVLQYKESGCQRIPAQYWNQTTNSLNIDNEHNLLDTICSDITGDAQLESLFRLDTPPIECPIGGKYQFNYDNCHESLSSLDSCIDKKQLHFKFAACPDVPASESRYETMKCYADWSEGNNYYMIGRLEHASNHQDKNKFRCFLYEKSPDGSYIQMSHSLEESCHGLINPTEGPKTLLLTAKKPTNHNCHFPSFVQAQSDNWLSVDNSLIYMFNQNSTKYQVKETREGNVIEEATCLQQIVHPNAQANYNHPNYFQQRSHHPRSNQQQATAQVVSHNNAAPNKRFPSSPESTTTSRPHFNDVVYLVQITKNCFTSEYCVRFYQRTNGIVQIDYFTASPGSDNQRCRNAYIGTPQTQIITSTNLENQQCPFDGVYTIEAPIESDYSYNPSNIFICPRQSFITAQCDNPSRLRIHYRCSPAKFMIKNLYCLGSWTTNGLVRLLLADDDRQRYSAWYRDYGTLQPTPDTIGSESSTISSQLATTTTRSQHLLGLSTNQQQSSQISLNSITTPVIDLQIALITPAPTIAKPMQVRLTRRHQCSDLRGYSSQGSFGSQLVASSSSMTSYGPSASSSSSRSDYVTLCKSSFALVCITTTMLSLVVISSSLQKARGTRVVVG